MNIISDVNAYLKTKITPYAQVIFIDAFPALSSEEIMTRHDPSQAVETRYMDGSRAGVFNFSYYAKSLDSLKAYQQLNAIMDALDLKYPQQITDVLNVKIEPINTPLFVSMTDGREFIYTLSLKLEYFVRRAS